MNNKMIGKIDISALNTLPEKHEFDTAKFFAKFGYDIEFVKPRYISGQDNPDFMMQGKIWETKSPIRYNRVTFEHTFKKAMKQSNNIIFDLRRLDKQDEELYLHDLKKRAKSRKIKNLVVISKDGSKLDIKGGI